MNHLIKESFLFDVIMIVLQELPVEKGPFRVGNRVGKRNALFRMSREIDHSNVPAWFDVRLHSSIQ